MIIEELGLKNGDVISARKITVQNEGEIKVEPIVDAEKKCLTPKAEEIFSEWFDRFKDPLIGKMTP